MLFEVTNRSFPVLHLPLASLPSIISLNPMLSFCSWLIGEEEIRNGRQVKGVIPIADPLPKCPPLVLSRSQSQESSAQCKSTLDCSNLTPWARDTIFRSQSGVSSPGATFLLSISQRKPCCNLSRLDSEWASVLLCYLYSVLWLECWVTPICVTPSPSSKRSMPWTCDRFRKEYNADFL